MLSDEEQRFITLLGTTPFEQRDKVYAEREGPKEFSPEATRLIDQIMMGEDLEQIPVAGHLLNRLRVLAEMNGNLFDEQMQLRTLSVVKEFASPARLRALSDEDVQFLSTALKYLGGLIAKDIVSRHARSTYGRSPRD